MEREKDIEARVKKGIEDAGGLFFKFTSPGNDGVPDRIAVLPGRTVYVELKTKTGKLSKLQRYQIGRLLRLRQQVCVVRGMEAAECFIFDMRAGLLNSIDYGPKGWKALEAEGGDDL